MDTHSLSSTGYFISAQVSQTALLNSTVYTVTDAPNSPNLKYRSLQLQSLCFQFTRRRRRRRRSIHGKAVCHKAQQKKNGAEKRHIIHQAYSGERRRVRVIFPGGDFARNYQIPTWKLEKRPLNSSSRLN